MPIILISPFHIFEISAKVKIWLSILMFNVSFICAVEIMISNIQKYNENLSNLRQQEIEHVHNFA